jgi:pimeloyl-ACP methyl ester carboxylesterase
MRSELRGRSVLVMALATPMAFWWAPVASARTTTGAPYPVSAAFAAAGPFSTTTVTITDGSATYDVFRPRYYDELGFKSPIVTWGNGTNATPDSYTTLLTHFASYGFTVIATTLVNTGSGREIDAAARYLVKSDTASGSLFARHLDVHEVAAVGHSQGATGAVRAATADPRLITSVMTFSLPNIIWSAPNPDCPIKTDCESHPNRLTQPVFFISTHGPLDAIITSPANEQDDYESVRGRAALGIIALSGGRRADHSSIEDADVGGNPQCEIGYATAWLEYTLRDNKKAAAAFSGRHPELVSNGDWPGSMVKQ